MGLLIIYDKSTRKYISRNGRRGFGLVVPLEPEDRVQGKEEDSGFGIRDSGKTKREKEKAGRLALPSSSCVIKTSFTASSEPCKTRQAENYQEDRSGFRNLRRLLVEGEIIPVYAVVVCTDPIKFDTCDVPRGRQNG